jgi:hypothetical protein
MRSAQYNHELVIKNQQDFETHKLVSAHEGLKKLPFRSVIFQMISFPVQTMDVLTPSAFCFHEPDQGYGGQVASNTKNGQ